MLQLEAHHLLSSLANEKLLKQTFFMYVTKPIAQLYAIYFHYAQLQHTVFTYACVCMYVYMYIQEASHYQILFLFYFHFTPYFSLPLLLYLFIMIVIYTITLHGFYYTSSLVKLLVM